MKYMGSKNRISKDIVPIIQKLIYDNDIELYIEPFVGGANIIDKIKCKFRYGCDINEYLISLLKAVQDGNDIPINLSKEQYDDIKNNKENFPKWIVGVAGFLATYNAKWFGGYAKITKTKTGTIRNYYDESRRNLLSQKNGIKEVIFLNKTYDTFKNELSGALIYCDPPYAGTTKYRDEFNHDEFWEWARRMSLNNIVLVSEYNAPEDFDCIWSKELTTTLDNSSRSKSIEKLFVYKPL